MNTAPRLCIIGIGNSLRSDDGIGEFVCAGLAELPLLNTEILLTQQLQVDWLDKLSAFNTIICIDATMATGQPVSFHALGEQIHSATNSSHVLHPETMGVLLKELYQVKPDIFICAVPGYNFELGTDLSDAGKKGAIEALDLLRRWITENKFLQQA